MMLYLIDANVPIRAHGDYYPIDRIGLFWEWLLAMADGGYVKMPREIYDEVAKSPDLLGQWLRRPEAGRVVFGIEICVHLGSCVVSLRSPTTILPSVPATVRAPLRIKSDG